MRILFAGTPNVAIPTLEWLFASEHEVVGVLTRPAAAQGRSSELID
ncbi:MAG: methionyl-tRNA formyltransferase, partial [Actinobacteria bacterium]|nr:methionyl-tRNA formyltransferase [Actinomycetota bacterium]